MKIRWCATIWMLLTLTASVAAQTYLTNGQPAMFGRDVSNWVRTGSIEYRVSAEKACDGKVKIRVDDGLINLLIERNRVKMDAKTYTLDTFFNCLQKEMNKDKVEVEYSNVEPVPYYRLEKPNITKRAPSRMDVEFYACKVTFSVNGKKEQFRDLIYVRNNKISKISELKLTKRKKIKVDYSDLIDEEPMKGVMYTYGQHFPIGLSASFSFEGIPFMLSCDVGGNIDKKTFVSDKVDMKDILNFKRVKTYYDPKYYWTVTPYLFLTYFAVGCGVGFAQMNATIYEDESKSENYITGRETVFKATSCTDVKLKPMIRPVVRVFIPLTDDLYLSLSGGYDLIFGCKQVSGYNVGLGFQWYI